MTVTTTVDGKDIVTATNVSVLSDTVYGFVYKKYIFQYLGTVLHSEVKNLGVGLCSCLNFGVPLFVLDHILLVYKYIDSVTQNRYVCSGNDILAVHCVCYLLRLSCRLCRFSPMWVCQVCNHSRSCRSFIIATYVSG